MLDWKREVARGAPADGIGSFVSAFSGPAGNPYQDALQQRLGAQSVSPLGANGLPETDMFGKPWPGSAPKAPTSNTMPVAGPRPQVDPYTGSNDWDTPAGRERFKAMWRAGKFGSHDGMGGASVGNLPSTPMPNVPKGDPYTGFQAKHDYSAFDTAREQNPGKSAKDAFVYLSNQAPPPPMHDKTALEAWFNQYIKPGMDALGHKVSSVTGDKFSYGNHEGNFTVDYAQNAGAAPGSMLQRLQWGADPGDDATRAR